MHIGDQIEIRVIPNIFMKIAAIYNLRAAIRVSDFEHSRALSDRQEHRQDTSFNFKPVRGAASRGSLFLLSLLKYRRKTDRRPQISDL
jgi:hypothetical protein